MLKKYILKPVILWLLLFLSAITQAQVLDIAIDDQNGINGLVGASNLAISTDGQHLYAVGYSDQAIVVFKRSGQTFSLEQTITDESIGGGLQGVFAIGISPDDKHVYVTNVTDNSLVVFSRDSNNGHLTLVEILQDDVAGIDGLNAANKIAFSSDNLRLYAISLGDKSLAVFSRDPLTGTLDLLSIQKDETNEITTLDGANSVTVAPDNRFIYVAAITDNAINVFVRDVDLGEISFVTSYQDGMENVSSLTISSDGKYLYSVSNNNVIIVFTRDIETGLLSLIEEYQNGSDNVTGLNGLNTIVISQDENKVYIAGTNAVSIFSRDIDSGKLTFQQTIANNTQDITTLENIFDIVASPDANGVIYIAAFNSNAITALDTFAVDLTVSLTVPNTIALDSVFNYIITVNNNGSDTATDVRLENDLPAGLIFTSATTELGSCQYDNTVHQIYCLFDSLVSSSNIDISLAIPNELETGQLINNATISSSQTDTDLSNNTASATMDLVEAIIKTDLQVEVLTNLEIVATNYDLTYNLRVTNLGPDVANDVVLTATLATNITYDAAASDNGCSQIMQELTCNLASINLNDTIEIPVVVKTSSETGSVTLTAQVTSPNFDFDTENNLATKTNTIELLQFDLAIIDAYATPSNLAVGSELTYTIVVKNQGTITVDDVLVTGYLPPQIAYISDSNNCSINQSQISCQLGSLTADLTKEIIITGRAIQTGTEMISTFAVTGNGSDIDETNDSLIGTVGTVSGQAADFVVTINDAEQSVLVNKAITYDINVTNNGANDAAAILNVTLVGHNISIESLNNENCTGGLTFSCQLEILPVGETKTISLTVIPTTIEILVLSAEVIGNAFDPNIPNTATIETAITNKESNLAVTLAATPESVLLAQNITYSAIVTNHGPHQATGVQFEQQLPSNVEFISVAGSQGQDCQQVENLITCLLGPIEVGAEATVNLVVKTQLAGQLNSIAKVNSSSFDAVQTDNLVNSIVNVTPQTADLAIAISRNPETTLVDMPISYTINLTNQGPDPAINIILTNQFSGPIRLPSAPNFVPANAGECTVLESGNILTCSIASIPNNGSLNLEFTIQANITTDLELHSEIITTSVDNDSSNNQATVVTKINNPASFYFVEAQVNGEAGVQGLKNAFDLAMSADGRFLYASGFSNQAVAVFQRNNNDGSLQFIQSLLNDTQAHLNQVSAITLSPDDAYIYITSFSDNAISVFKRDANTGLLFFVATYKDIAGLTNVFSLVATENHLYAAGTSESAITLFNRDVETGKLDFVALTTLENSAQINALAVTDNFLFAANLNGLLVFNRDATSGQLTLKQTLTDGVSGVQGLTGVNGIKISPDGRFVYTAAGNTDNGSVAAFSLSPDSGILSLVETYYNGNNGISGLNGAAAITIDANGEMLYVVSSSDNALITFERNISSGRLTFSDVQMESADIQGLKGARAVTVSPSATHIYVASFADSAIAVFSVATADLLLTVADMPEVVAVGNNLTYTVNIHNQGIYPATGIILEGELSHLVNLISLQPSQGNCNLVANTISCYLGSLENGSSLAIPIIISPLEQGELILNMRVFTKQFNSNINEIAVTTSVVVEADLSVEFNNNTDISPVAVPLSYKIIVTNQSEVLVKNIILQDSLPENIKFEAVAIEGVGNNCEFDESSRIINCAITQLTSNQQITVTIIVTPMLEGVTLINTATIDADIIDTNTADNQATHTIKVDFNIVTTTYYNAEQNVHNPQILEEGTIIEGSVSGYVDNQGLLSDVAVSTDTIVNGGILSGTITNEGHIENVRLLGDTIINGGSIGGEIIGSSTAPAKLNNLHIIANTSLTNVILGKYNEIADGVILGAGVKFADHDAIPTAISLISVFPMITGAIEGSETIDVDYSILVTGSSLLEEINAIPELKNNNLAFVKDNKTGQLLLAIGSEEVMVIRIVAVQLGNGEAGIKVHSQGQVTMTTTTGLVITTQPGIQDQLQMLTVLEELGIIYHVMTADGNLRIKINDINIITRPDLYTYLANPILPLGFDAEASTIVADLQDFVFRYQVENTDLHRQQKLYPVPAYKEELRNVLAGYPGASEVRFFNNGKVTVNIDEVIHSAIFDYPTLSGTSNSMTQFLFIPDRNNDGSQELKILYTNGEEQILYILPAPKLVTEIQNIAAVQATDYIISQNTFGYYNLSNGENSFLMAITSTVPSNQPAGIEIRADGSIIFITNEGLIITMQPVVRNLSALKTELNQYGINQITEENNGNLSIPISANSTIIVRPALHSNPVWFAMPLGLHYMPTFLPAITEVLFVYLDNNGQKQSQSLYPSAKYPGKLSQFLQNISGVEQVIFENNGIISVTGNRFNFKGLISYAVEIEGTAITGTGNIQFIETTDLNSDGADDFAVIYDNGDRQVIYRIPVVEF